LRDADIEIPVEVDERAVAPQFMLDLLARQNLTRILGQQTECLQLLRRQLQQHATSAQFVGLQVQLESSKAKKAGAGLGRLHGISIKPACRLGRKPGRDSG
jgi:hypothetical protein